MCTEFETCGRGVETGHAHGCNSETGGKQEANMPLLVDPQIDGFRKFPYTSYSFVHDQLPPPLQASCDFCTPFNFA